MDTAQRDVADLFEYASQRLTERMAGLDDDEWAWQPISGDPDVTIRWRLDHITDTLADDRNWVWLGADPVDAPQLGPAPSAEAALGALTTAITAFLVLVEELGDAAGSPIGDVAGPYGEATKRSFVLHVVDELIHHAAEAALLRDLYAASGGRR